MTESDDAGALSRRVRAINLAHAMAATARQSKFNADVSAIAPCELRGPCDPHPYGEASLPVAGSEGAVIDVLPGAE